MWYFLHGRPHVWPKTLTLCMKSFLNMFQCLVIISMPRQFPCCFFVINLFDFKSLKHRECLFFLPPPHQWFAAALAAVHQHVSGALGGTCPRFFNFGHDIKVPLWNASFFQVFHCLSFPRVCFAVLLSLPFWVWWRGGRAARPIGRRAKVWFTIVPHWVLLDRHQRPTR